MIDASAGLRTASCPRCDLLFSLETQPTLTDEERKAVSVARDAYADDDGNAECEEIAAVLSRLLERMK